MDYAIALSSIGVWVEIGYLGFEASLYSAIQMLYYWKDSIHQRMSWFMESVKRSLWIISGVIKLPQSHYMSN